MRQLSKALELYQAQLLAAEGAERVIASIRTAVHPLDVLVRDLDVEIAVVTAAQAEIASFALTAHRGKRPGGSAYSTTR